MYVIQNKQVDVIQNKEVEVEVRVAKTSACQMMFNLFTILYFNVSVRVVLIDMFIFYI